MSRPNKWTYEKVKEITKEFQGESLNSLKKIHGLGAVYYFIQKNGYSPEEFGLVRKKIKEDQQYRGEYSDSPEWSSYKNMRLRCYDPKHRAYKWYGGRGIKVCDRWMETPYGFLTMVRDLGEKPTPKHQIDRIDEDKDYSPENCVWSSHKDNQHRRKKNSNYPNRVKPNKHTINPGDRFGKYTVIRELETVRTRQFLCSTPEGTNRQMRINSLLRYTKED